MKNKKLYTWLTSTTLVAVFCIGYYSLTWGSVNEFNRRLDLCEELFCDFTIHYYPTAQLIFENGEPIYGYLYTPFFAMLTAPLGHLSLYTATIIWGIIQTALTLALFVAPLSTLKLDTLQSQLIYTGIFFTSLPVWHNFKWGQVSSLMTLMIITAFLAHKSKKSVWAGIMLGFATSIKYYPGIFILFFLLKRDRRAIISFVVTCALFLFIMPISILGFDVWIEFLVLTLRKISVTSNEVNYLNTQYFPYVLMRLLEIASARVFVARVLRTMGILFVFLNVCLLWFVQKQRMDRSGILTTSLLFCLLPFLIATSWHHYFIFLPFAQVSLLQMEQRNGRTFLIILSIVMSSIFIVNLFPTWLDYTKWGFSFLSTSLILVSIYLIILETYLKQKGTVS